MEWIAGLVSAALVGIAGVIAALYKRNQNKQDQYKHEEQLIKLSKGISDSNKILKDFTSLSRDMDYLRDGMTSLHREIKELKGEVVQVKENCAATDIMLLRREIYNIYFNYEKEKKLPEREFETALNLYTVYHSLGGNGSAEQYINEIKGWVRY